MSRSYLNAMYLPYPAIAVYVTHGTSRHSVSEAYFSHLTRFHFVQLWTLVLNPSKWCRLPLLWISETLGSVDAEAHPRCTPSVFGNTYDLESWELGTSNSFGGSLLI